MLDKHSSIMTPALNLFDRTTVDNFVFRLHAKYTTVIFLCLSVFVLGHSYFTDVIDCAPRDSDVPNGILDAACYVQGTFSVEQAWAKDVGQEVPYPGIESYDNASDTRIYHYYYKWVGWVLLLQTLVFFLPGYFWRCTERGRIKNILSKLSEPSQQLQLTPALIASPANPDGKTGAFAFLNYRRQRDNLAALVAFSLFELLNTISLIVQIIFLNAFFNGNFLAYGWLTLFSNDIPDHQTRVFPDQAKCTYLRFASSGIGIQRHDCRCLLTSNYLYAKIFMFIWIWFHFLLALGVIALIFRIFTLCSPKARLLSTELPTLQRSTDDLRNLVEKLPLGTWFILHLLSKNMEQEEFADVVRKVLPTLVSNGNGIVLEVKANGMGA